MRGVLAAGIALLAIVAAMLLALTSPITTALAATVLTLEPLNLGVSDLTRQQLGGSLCNAPNKCVNVPYTAELSLISIPGGAVALNAGITATRAADPAGTIIVSGYSEGAQVASRWMNDFGSLPNAPQNLSFYLIGNPCRKYGGYTAPLGQLIGLVTPPDTQYQVVDVARQYDGWADAPTDPSNQLAVANAMAGALFIHTDYTNVNLNDPNNVTWREGNITYVLVPTEIVPLLFPFQEVAQSSLGQLLGWDTLLDSVNAQLKPIIDSAYVRPVPIPSATSASDTVADTQLSMPLALANSASSSLDAAVANAPADLVDTANPQSQDSPATQASPITAATEAISGLHSTDPGAAAGEISEISGAGKTSGTIAATTTTGTSKTRETSAAVATGATTAATGPLGLPTAAKGPLGPTTAATAAGATAGTSAGTISTPGFFSPGGTPRTGATGGTTPSGATDSTGETGAVSTAGDGTPGTSGAAGSA